ncbi:hypothetical protein [Niveibacterium umoris]|uniref:Uncharacterized protein n=2 Tax=Niveibacterium umoris TaxID=1193620 RepID=A0A840BJL3_9RHOO|nr:hypothetical protein [Niveibacterium umoris]MBB4012584.1 hypothetical protein [Niveibacterium umoris]
MCRPLARTGLALVAAGSLATAQAANSVLCHVTYGGQTQVLRAHATTSPYTVAPVSVGSYFLFRIVFERAPAGLAAVKLYTYADKDDGAVPIHVAEFPLPLPAGGRYGFTGMQRVYEPVRDGELEYWCEMREAGARR